MSHLCILFVYKNTEHIKLCFDSLKEEQIDFWVIENHSENSKEIQEYFKETGRISRYFYFKKNVLATALKTIIENSWKELHEYDFVTVTDCDLLLENAHEAFPELRKNSLFDEVAFSCVDLKMENFPSWITGAEHWIPNPKEYTKEYIECPTGIHMMTLRKDMFYLLRDNEKFIDSYLLERAYANNKKWVKTLNNKATHLTWDLYVEGNPYYNEKVSLNYDSWNQPSAGFEEIYV